MNCSICGCSLGKDWASATELTDGTWAHDYCIPVYGDIRKVDFTKLEPVEVLTGGFPCQDISIAGLKKGIGAERSGLWSEFYRAICEIRPKIVLVENVPNLVNLGLDVVLANLAEAGYDAEWFTLCASDFGAPHKRERIFIFAYPNDKRHGRRSENGAVERSQANGTKVSGRTNPNFVADDWQERIEGFKQETLQGVGGFSWCQNVRRIEDFKGRQDIPEPLFRGSRDGVPFWVDRVASCGNAVVPQVAQFIARQINEFEANP
jgi:DNA (cytosine-5)-methyltransferase 1